MERAIRSIRRFRPMSWPSAAQASRSTAIIRTTAKRAGAITQAAGASIGSGGGISLYESEPAYQQGVQSLGMRTTPDVALVADPATGAWIADTYNIDPSNPFQVVGGTSLSAPAWAGLLALVDQGRAAAGESALNTAGPTEAQQALYSLPQSDYNTITTGSNGYTAAAGYNLVTGLGTPVANSVVSDLVAYQGPGTTYSGPAVGPLQNAGLDSDWTGSGGPTDVFSVFDSLRVTGTRLGTTAAHVLSREPGTPDTGIHASDATDPGSTRPHLTRLAELSTAAEPGLGQSMRLTAAAAISAVDQVLGILPDATLTELVIGDLAFEQALLNTHNGRGSRADAKPD